MTVFKHEFSTFLGNSWKLSQEQLLFKMSKRSNPYNWPRPGPQKKHADETQGGKYVIYPQQSQMSLAPRGQFTVPRTTGGQTQGESKYFDTRLALTSIPSVAAWTGTEFDPTTFNTLCVPTVGSAVNQRIGREIKVHKIKINGHIRTAKIDAAVALDATHIRIALVQDTQTNATQMQGEQVFTATITTDEAPLTFQNIDNFGRFRVLKDKHITLQDPNLFGATGADVNGLVRPFKFSVKFNNPISVRFNATNGGSVADIVDNSFHVVANSSNVDLVPQLSYLCRVVYKE